MKGLSWGSLVGSFVGGLIACAIGNCQGYNRAKEILGTIHEECYPNNTCKTEELECRSNICVEKK